MNDAKDMEDTRGAYWALMMPWYQKHHASSWFSHEPSPGSHADSFPSSTCASERPHKKDTSEGEGRAERVAARIVNDFLGQSSRTIQYIPFKRRWKWDAKCATSVSIILTRNRDSSIFFEIISWIPRNHTECIKSVKNSCFLKKYIYFLIYRIYTNKLCDTLY